MTLFINLFLERKNRKKQKTEKTGKNQKKPGKDRKKDLKTSKHVELKIRSS
jgi:hypothetical protein